MSTLIIILLIVGLVGIVVYRPSYWFFIFFLAVFVGLDIYVFNGIENLGSSSFGGTILLAGFVLMSLIGYYGFFRAFSLVRIHPLERSRLSTFVFGFAISLLTAKAVFALLLLLQDIGRLLVGLINYVGVVKIGSLNVNQFSPDRLPLLIGVSVLAAAIPFFAMLYGVTWGKYRFTIELVKLKFNDLPPAFQGLRILQISDAHSGTWDNVESVARGIKMINDQEADLILFTGDLVNGNKDEIDPYIELFASLKAPLGKFAVLGNHDYYGNPQNQEKRQAYWADFYKKFDKMGFHVLNNDKITFNREGQKLQLLGVENWGLGRWFPKRGDLDQALRDCDDSDFCILMSHDPTHWSEKVLLHPKKIQLTLSGHTHGMQFGINLGKFKWSPIQYRYKNWMGLYEKAGQKLYVNRGFGFLAFPGRVGMWPEITVFEFE